MFAIVQISGKQYKVSPGDVVEVDRVAATPGASLTFDHVLLTEDEKGVAVGTPTVKGMKVVGKVLDQTKGVKIDVRRYKSKVRYRRQTGFRPKYTKIQIVSVGHA